MMTRFTFPKIKRRILIAAFAVFLLLTAGLAFDLANRGLVWQFAWSVTGEEEPIAQVRGMVEYFSNVTRPQPRTDPLTPVNYAHVNPYGINTFLQLEVESVKVERQLQMVSEAGFAWIRQQFEWAEIEVDGRGQFTDSRNDHNGDGQNDTISGWDKYDRIVALAEQYDLEIQARLDNPPAWTHANPDVGSFAPPDDLQDFVNFASAVAERYQGRIHFYQIWNEPNIFPEWGNQSVDPERYTELLCRTYAALKAVDPDIVVISGALAPTVSLTGRDLNDFIFLQRMYDAGAGACFDILSVQGYGLFSGPTDHRMRPTTVNIGRNQYIRDMMIANGDENKAIWFSEMAWNSVPPASEVPDVAEPRDAYGQVTPQQAADYAPLLYQRAQEDWPWVGVINYWFMTRPDDTWRTRPEYYFRMVEPDYSEDHPTYTPLPVYDSMREWITTQTPTLYTGLHYAEQHWAVRQREVDLNASLEAQRNGLSSVTEYTFFAHGTDVRIRWQGALLAAFVDDGDLRLTPDSPTERNGWYEVTLHHSTRPQTIMVRLVTNTPFTLETITVLDRSFQNLFPIITLISVGIGMLILAILMGIAERRAK